jgi:predicted house-cleaning noncanonical NTP pyrophosphatase (MazG superfamily)
MAQSEWIKRLANRVIEILESSGKPISRETYESRAFTEALKKAALEQRIDIFTDNATRIYARNTVKESVKALLRYRNRKQAEARRHRPITDGITAPAKGWLENALPPGDRD